MAERVYIETTVVSYLTARPNRDVVIAGHQQITHDWWDTRRESYELCVSQLVRKEAGAGDPLAAHEGCGRCVAYCRRCHERDSLPVDLELPPSGECHDAALDRKRLCGEGPQGPNYLHARG